MVLWMLLRSSSPGSNLGQNCNVQVEKWRCWTCVVVGRTQPSNANSFRGINAAPKGWLGAWVGHQVVAAELWVGVGWRSCPATPHGQVSWRCAWSSQHQPEVW